jgi:cell division control protein 6
MSDYDDLFDATAPDDSVFADKGALDPLSDPEEIVARKDQQRKLATLLNGVHEGYLPSTVSIYGPPGTGKTLTTRRLCEEFAARTDELAVEYVTKTEHRTVLDISFSLVDAISSRCAATPAQRTSDWSCPEYRFGRHSYRR